MFVTLNDDTWQFTSSNYLSFIHTKDLGRFADAWEQTELAKILFL